MFRGFFSTHLLSPEHRVSAGMSSSSSRGENTSDVTGAGVSVRRDGVGVELASRTGAACRTGTAVVQRCRSARVGGVGHVFARHAELRILASEDILPVLHFGLNLERKRSETDHLKSD